MHAEGCSQIVAKYFCLPSENPQGADAASTRVMPGVCCTNEVFEPLDR